MYTEVDSLRSCTKRIPTDVDWHVKQQQYVPVSASQTTHTVTPTQIQTHTTADDLDRYTDVWTWMTDVWVPSNLCVCVCVNHRIPEGKACGALGLRHFCICFLDPLLFFFFFFLLEKYMCCGSYFSPLAPLTLPFLIGQRSLDYVQIGYWDMTLRAGKDPKK